MGPELWSGPRMMGHTAQSTKSVVSPLCHWMALWGLQLSLGTQEEENCGPLGKVRLPWKGGVHGQGPRGEVVLLQGRKHRSVSPFDFLP